MYKLLLIICIFGPAGYLQNLNGRHGPLHRDQCLGPALDPYVVYTPGRMASRFIHLFLFLDIKNSILDIKNSFLDIKNSYMLTTGNLFLISINDFLLLLLKALFNNFFFQFNSVYFNHKNNTKDTCKSNMNQIKRLQMLCTLYNDEIGD